MNRTHQNEVRLLLARLTEILEKSSLQTKRETRIEAGLLTQIEAARQVGVSAQVLRNEIAAGKVAGPSHKTVGGRVSYYSPADVEELKGHFASRPGRTSADVAARRRADGFYSRADVAARCGLSCISLNFHEQVGRINPPRRRYPGTDPKARYYSEGEAAEIEKIMRERIGFRPTGKRGKRAAA